ncbi:MAG: hypothetical protein OEZ06_13400 [Myxococcales bacterium]|nr:hypothetical protein [Myxococcales bacterium]
MSTFSIDRFAAECKQAMAGAPNACDAARQYLEQSLGQHDRADIIAVLEAAIPAGASVGEMIVHQSPELTMLYARVPGRFRSGIHNHTVFACIAQLEGEERSTVYAQSDEGLRVREELGVVAGEVMELPADAIHHIENPLEQTSSALHIYGGDFGALMAKRSLWTEGEHAEVPFSFEGLVKQAAIAMKREGNAKGLEEMVNAIPATKALVDSL